MCMETPADIVWCETCNDVLAAVGSRVCEDCEELWCTVCEVAAVGYGVAVCDDCRET